MKSTLSLVFALFAASISAAPAASSKRDFPAITIQFANDMSGANADATLVANGTPNSVAHLFAGSSIDNGGEIIATSSQLVNFIQGLSCVVTGYQGTVIASLSTDKTFADLDGNPNAAIPTVVSGDSITCEVV